MPAQPLVPLDEMKAYLGQTSANSDVVIQALIDATPMAFAAYCAKDDIISADYTAYRDGTGSPKMVMVNSPMTKVSSVKIGGRDIPKSENGGMGYDFVPGGKLVFLRGFIFERGIRNVLIGYTAGFNDADGKFPVPADLTLAAKLYVATRFREKDRLGMGSKSLAGESISYSDFAGRSNNYGMPPTVANILENYMNFIPEVDRL